MYEAYWRLQSKPFEPQVDARSYYPSEVHQGAMLKLRYAIENQRGAALLAGAPGTGKSMLIHSLRRQLPEAFSPFVHLVFPQLSQREMLAYLAAELDPAHELPTASVDASVRRLQHFLAQNATQGRHAVVAVDEAHLLLDSNGLETVRLLLNFDRAGRPALTLLLLGTPALLTGLERMPALDQRLGVKCLLRPLTLEETVSYVNHRLTAAGAKQEIFTSEALQSLFQLTLGNPRLINRLCDLALLIGYAEEQPSIGQAQLEAVSNELVTVQPE